MRKILALGGTAALAKETLRHFAQDGDSFLVVARDAEKLSTVCGDLRARGAKEVKDYCLDLAQIEKHEQLFKFIEAEFEDFDLVLLAYGTLSNQDLGEHDFSHVQQEINTNLLSPISLLTHLSNSLEKKQRGTIAVITSVAGDRGRQSNYIYGTTKGALSIFLQGLRNRLFRSSVHVITIKPGFIDTPMTAKIEKRPFVVSSEIFGKLCYQAILKKKDVAYIPFRWAIIMAVITHIPERIFKRLSL